MTRRARVEHAARPVVHMRAEHSHTYTRGRAAGRRGGRCAPHGARTGRGVPAGDPRSGICDLRSAICSLSDRGRAPPTPVTERLHARFGDRPSASGSARAPPSPAGARCAMVRGRVRRTARVMARGARHRTAGALYCRLAHRGRWAAIMRLLVLMPEAEDDQCRRQELGGKSRVLAALVTTAGLPCACAGQARRDRSGAGSPALHSTHHRRRHVLRPVSAARPPARYATNVHNSRPPAHCPQQPPAAAELPATGAWWSGPPCKKKLLCRQP